MTYTQTHMKPDRRAHAHTKHKKWQRHTGDTQLAYTLAGGLQTHRSDHSHTPCSANLCHTALPVPSSQREKNWKNTLLTLVLGCHLTYTECISNSWEYLVSACSILRLHAHPGSHFRLLKACTLEQSQAKRWTFKAFKNSSCRESKAVGSGGDRCGWFMSAWEGQILVFTPVSSVAEPNKNFVEFSSATNHNYVNDTTQSSL